MVSLVLLFLDIDSKPRLRNVVEVDVELQEADLFVGPIRALHSHNLLEADMCQTPSLNNQGGWLA